MGKSVEQLKQALIQERQTYQEIVDLAHRKTKVITGSKVRELEEITQKEQQYILKLGTFEKIRRSILTNMEKEFLVEEITNISEIMPFLEKEDAMEIDDLRNQLLQTIDDLKRVNTLNEKLLKESLEYIQLTIDLMTNVNQEDNQYQNTARQKEKTKAHLFDMRV